MGGVWGSEGWHAELALEEVALGIEIVSLMETLRVVKAKGKHTGAHANAPTLSDRHTHAEREKKINKALTSLRKLTNWSTVK